jgi:hypothetical protein
MLPLVCSANPTIYKTVGGRVLFRRKRNRLHDRCRRRPIPGNPPTKRIAYIYKDQPSWPISVSDYIY